MTNRLRDAKGRFISSNGKGQVEQLASTINQRLASIVNESLHSQRRFFDSILDPRRNIDDECGYPQTDALDIGEYKRLYDREPIATRVVEVLPKESWQVPPEVFEVEEMDTITEFEREFKELGTSLRGEESWHKETEGNIVWDYMLRGDIGSGIGSYGIFLLGLDDGKELQEPAVPRDGQELIFLRVMDKSLVDIKRMENDKKNPRFGKPDSYNVTFATPDRQNFGDAQESTETFDVHWSRVIHLADNLTSSEVFGIPRLQQVYNRNYDLRKIYGADGETYWRNAVLKIFLETHPQLGGDVKTSNDDIKSAMEEMMNGMQQWMMLKGMSARTVAPAISDPSDHINAHIEAICIRLGIPKRIFVGSERGDLASSQDDDTWNGRLHHRQTTYLTPRVIVPFVDRLIGLKVLPEPQEGYTVKWPDLNTLTDIQKAAVALQKTESLVKYVQGNGQALVAPIDFLTRYQDFTQEEAEAIIETAMEGLEQEREDNIADGLNPDGTPIIEEPPAIPPVEEKV